MSIVERIGRQILPIFLIVEGFGAVGYTLLVSPSSYGQRIALIFCGVFAAGMQMIATLLFSKHRYKFLIALIDIVILISAVMIVRFGEYIARDFLEISIQKYSYYPGPVIDLVSALVAAAAVTALAFYPKSCTTHKP
ncbi:hypothetical protein [Arcanobacterium hippocoleae]|uniref:hypothetical protein n=1 Tax=Arcanobacterium hippocoleae TaxID=149017 RepID=UPI00333FF6AE